MFFFFLINLCCFYVLIKTSVIAAVWTLQCYEAIILYLLTLKSLFRSDSVLKTFLEVKLLSKGL